MKLVSFGAVGEERPGVIAGGEIVDLLAVDRSLPATMRGILVADALARVAEIAARAASLPARARRALGSVRLGPPVTDPSKIICVGRNYPAHAAEQGREPPGFPLLFGKGPNALCGNGDAVPYPRDTEALDYEVELAFVIGARASSVPRTRARACVAGYTVLVDLTARDLQRREGQWFRAKSFDGAAPMGPYLVTGDEVGDPHALAISLEVNGETRQSSRTSEMTFTVDDLVAHITKTITLEPGDVVATGTPAGVGAHSDPPRFLARGDRLSARVESLGALAVIIV
jgi:2-keto-4-pentenoate hydratase/2-oxohepta-3-ene-1,7-dioic acid hydratase in catechol pathway